MTDRYIDPGLRDIFDSVLAGLGRTPHTDALRREQAIVVTGDRAIVVLGGTVHVHMHDTNAGRTPED
jgi:pyruvate/2-oxoglutarate dehydrogenase complex dihydrolipoamide dehydrogenase (E3) component